MRAMDTKCCIELIALKETTKHLAREMHKSHRGNPEMGRNLPNRPHVKIF